MEYIYLLLSMSASALLSIMSSLFGKQNKNAKNTSFLYSAVVTFAAFVTWGIVCLCKSEFDMGVILYSVTYGFFYTLAMIGMFKAYQTGSVSLTAFIKQLSLIAVAFWGFLFWENTVTLNISIGLVLIVVALYLCFKTDKSSKNPVSLKWCIFALLLLAGNAGCSIVQKYQQLATDGHSGNVFMFFGTLISFVICLILYLSNKPRNVKDVSKYSLVYPIIGGISSAVLNLFILKLISSPLPESIIFPGIAVGGLILTMVFSLTVYREKFNIFKWCGFLVGIVALILLNL